MKRAIFLLLILSVLLFAFGCAAAPGADRPNDGKLDDPSQSIDPEAMGALEFVWSDNEGGYYVFEKDGNTATDIIIPSIYNGKAVVGIGRHAFGAYSKVERVYVPSSVRVIDSQAFNYCDYLVKVEFAENSSLLRISDYAFFNCKSIVSINIPKSVTDIGYRAFSTCPSLKSITVDKDNQTYCSKLGAVYSKDMKTIVAQAPASYLSDNMMEPGGDESMAQIIVPDGVEVIGAGAFADCKGIYRIYIPDSVITIEKAAFAYCEGLTEIVFSEGSKLEIIGESSFRECSSLVSVTIPSGVKSIERYAFYCDNALVTFNFNGSIEEWSLIEKGEKWDVNTGKYKVNCTDGVIEK